MSANMKFNPAFFERLERNPAVGAICRQEAEKVAAAARATAPVDTGAYRASIHVEMKTQGRIVALVVASDPATMIIESQTGNLRRALGALNG